MVYLECAVGCGGSEVYASNHFIGVRPGGGPNPCVPCMHVGSNRYLKSAAAWVRRRERRARREEGGRGGRRSSNE